MKVPASQRILKVLQSPANFFFFTDVLKLKHALYIDNIKTAASDGFGKAVWYMVSGNEH